MKTQNPTAAQYSVSPELQKAFDACEAARAQCKKLSDRIDEAAEQRATISADLERLRSELATEEGALALAEGGDVKRLEKSVDRLASEIDGKERDLKRAQARIEALEPVTPSLDLQVKACGVELEAALATWSQQAAQALSEEIAEAVKPLAAVMARAQALAVVGGNLKDFCAAVYCPDPTAFRRVWTSQGWVNEGANLLAGEQPTDAIAEPLSAMVASVRSARFHTDYTPLSRRPKFQAARIEAPAAAAMAEAS